jgi:hypothetical protein
MIYFHGFNSHIIHGSLLEILIWVVLFLHKMQQKIMSTVLKMTTCPQHKKSMTAFLQPYNNKLSLKLSIWLFNFISGKL